jgi:hypothetical protein
MSNFENDRYVVTNRRRRTWGWLTGIAVLILVVVGVIFSTGRWGEDATRTGGGAAKEQALSGGGSSQPGVPNAPSR